MAVSYETEEYLKEYHPNDGAIETTIGERKDFLKDMTTASLETMIWSLDQRETHIKQDSWHFSYDEVTGVTQSEENVRAWMRGNYWSKAKVGNYAILAHKVRDSARKIIQDNIFDPLNKFLEKEKLPTLGHYVDKKLNIFYTIYGKKCDTKCSEYEGKYWWCATSTDLLGSTERSWDYCSPPVPKKTNLQRCSMHK